jgi:hypothetical protein
MKRKMNKMVWVYVDRWLRGIVESENISDKSSMATTIKLNFWNQILNWWRNDTLPLYEKKWKWM